MVWERGGPGGVPPPLLLRCTAILILPCPQVRASFAMDCEGLLGAACLRVFLAASLPARGVTDTLAPGTLRSDPPGIRTKHL